jgi:hypothetical protein
VVKTVIIGGSISGYRSIDSLLSEYKPKTITPINIRIVLTGFLTAVLYKLMVKSV